MHWRGRSRVGASAGQKDRQMRDKQLWQYILRGAEVRGAGSWFWCEFRGAARAIVDRWGPKWTRWRVVGEPLGVWLLLLAWLAPGALVPVWLIRRIAL